MTAVEVLGKLSNRLRIKAAQFKAQFEQEDAANNKPPTVESLREQAMGVSAGVFMGSAEAADLIDAEIKRMEGK